MNVFWQATPLPVPAAALFRAVLAAHHDSAARPNVSSQVIAATAFGSGDYCKALAAGLLTLGGVHAPLNASLVLLNHKDPVPRVRELLDRGRRVPGWGSSFHKGEADPLWQEVDTLLAEQFPILADRINLITTTLAECGKNLFPNPSCYTAATGLALRVPRFVLPYLFIAGRLDAWTRDLVSHNTNHQPH